MCYLCTSKYKIQNYMAGIYVHVPFCKSRCIYCGFYSTTALASIPRYVDRVIEELQSRSSYLQGAPVDTIYFGGGTPSVLDVKDLGRILDAIYNIYNVRAKAEVTVEGNPDDMQKGRLLAMRAMGVNRLSMGVQSFDDDRLRFLCRRHTAIQAMNAVRMAQACGFDNVSIDLMFGFPDQTLEGWSADVARALSLGVQHLSAYSLMYEEGTALDRMREDGRIKEVDEEIERAMFEHLIDAAKAAGFCHYEISNFCLPGMQSRHNSSYWHGAPYLGVGAGAHSYDGRNRCYNVDSLQAYLDGEPVVVEMLTEVERYDEYVFTALRTAEGVEKDDLMRAFGAEKYAQFVLTAQKHLLLGTMEDMNGRIKLTRAGVFVSNDIMSDFMLAD